MTLKNGRYAFAMPMQMRWQPRVVMRKLVNGLRNVQISMWMRALMLWSAVNRT